MTEDDKKLLIQKHVQELQQMYQDDPRQESFTALVLGELGSGKSFLASTARKPVHIDSFDPGGTKGLKKWIDKGEIIADVQWEKENPKKPTVFRHWKDAMANRVRMGYFDHIGTFWLDSSTSWGEAIMNSILLKAGIAGEPPRWSHDYVPQKAIIRNWVREMCNLPCDFIMTGHLEGVKDEVTGGMAYRYMTTGQGTTLIPMLFDEVYVMDPKKVASGVSYRILTQSTGTYVARSRLAKEGLLDVHEKADLKVILKKAGANTEDKPLLT
jgi:hypothetical protein